jgi:pimeloyl-ACP methyl ester carboxylesterase
VFPGIDVRAVDLQDRLEAETASMAGYAAAVTEQAKRLSRPLAMCGWSMGGLVVLLAAPVVKPHSLILVEPSAPAEVQGLHPETPLTLGSFDPEEVYGPFPAGWPARRESLLAPPGLWNGTYGSVPGRPRDSREGSGFRCCLGGLDTQSVVCGTKRQAGASAVDLL